MKKGICCAGNMIVDITYPIVAWPNQGELTHITEGIQTSTGGSVCNTISDLARLDPNLHLVASGYAGHDAEGDFILQEMRKYPNIDLSMVRRDGRTSFTAVMSNNQTKERTFFQHAGANAYYGEGQNVPESVIEAFVTKIVVHPDSFDWYFRFDGDPSDPLRCKIEGKRRTTTKIVVAGVNSPAIHTGNTGCHQGWQELRNYRKFASLTVTCEDAKAYLYSMSNKRRVHKWKDIRVNLYI